MTDQRTDARSSGVSMDPARLKALAMKRNGPAMGYLAATLAFLGGSGYVLHLSLESLWVLPAMLTYGGILTTSAYALSHETSHRTAFESRWVNDVLFFLASLIHMEETNYRRFAPEAKLPKLQRGARVFLAIYAVMAILIALGQTWLLVYLVLPRIAGAPFMTWITLIQHAEMQPDTLEIRQSTRSFKTNRLVELIYWNMNHHIEHHLYPTVPFYGLPALRDELGEQLPKPDPGALMTNIQVARAVFALEVRDIPRQLSS
jgi:fatty acid desaturase